MDAATLKKERDAVLNKDAKYISWMNKLETRKKVQLKWGFLISICFMTKKTQKMLS